MSERRKVVAGNWKMHLGPTEARRFVEALSLPDPLERRVAIFPPALSLAAVREALADRAEVELGVQNVHWEAQGAFTGELSGAMARDAGARLVLVGHSERRHVFGETDEEVARKVAAVAEQGLEPVVCVGETLDERRAGRLEEVLLRQTDHALERLPAGARYLLAYEPVWAIGTGRTATPDQAQEVHALIRAMIAKRDATIAAGLRILYGGSVKGGNAALLFAMEDIDGGLVGGASLEAPEFLKIFAAAAGTAD